MVEILEILVPAYVGGVIATLILFAAGKLGMYLNRRTHNRSIYNVSI